MSQKKYESAAEKQRAYRERQKVRNVTVTDVSGVGPGVPGRGPWSVHIKYDGHGFAVSCFPDKVRACALQFTLQSVVAPGVVVTVEHYPR